MGAARGIYLAGCNAIANAVTKEGFAHKKSQQRLVKFDGDLTFEISFQSSPRNFLLAQGEEDTLLRQSGRRIVGSLPTVGDLFAFGSVSLIAHTSVRARSICTWRESLDKPVRTDDLVCGGQLGNLRDKPKWITFNLANPNSRERVLGQVVELIYSVALPYHKRFYDPPQVIADLLGGKIPWSWEQLALDYVACYGTKVQTQALLERYLSEHPDQFEEFRTKLREYQANGVQKMFVDSRRAGRLAQSALSLGLQAV